MEKRKALLGLAVAGLIAAGGVAQSIPAYAGNDSEHGKDGCNSKEGCHGKKPHHDRKHKAKADQHQTEHEAAGGNAAD